MSDDVDRPDDAVVRITEGALGRGERTIYLAPGESHDHRDDDPSFCVVEALDDQGGSP